MTSSPRYLSLRDYLRVLRDNRVLLVVVTVVFVVVANRISNAIVPSYTAEASVALGSLSTDQTLAGLPAANSDQLPLQTPSVNAESITSPAIIDPVIARLRPRFPGITAGSLRGHIAARVEAQSNLVVLQASSTNPRLAEAEVNAVATQDAAVVTDQERARFAQAANSLRAQLATVRRSSTDQAERAAYADQIARLTSLLKFAQGAQVTQYSRLPTSPSSPDPLRDSILAGFVGLTLAIVIAFMRASMDRRARGASHIQRELGVSLLGRIGSHGLGRTGPVKNGRRRMSEADLEAFRILHANLEYLSPGRLGSVAVTSPLPEEGKSTVAMSLAFASYWAGKSTLLIEADMRRPSIARRAGLHPEPGLHELLTESAALHNTVQQMPLISTAQNGDRPAEQMSDRVLFDVITAGSKPHMPAELLGSDAFEELLKEATSYYESVILDTAPLLPVADTLRILPRVDCVLICVRLGRTRDDELRATRSALENLPARPSGLVLTGVRSGDESDYGYYPPSR